MIVMGSAQDIMQTFADKEIRVHFNSYNGWECKKAPSPVTRDPVFLISRDIRGRKETVALLVSFDAEPSVTALTAVSAGYTGRKGLKGRYLLVPKDADVSAVPKDIHILSMNAFGFADGELVWLAKKKGARHYAQPEETVAAAAAGPVCEPHAA